MYTKLLLAFALLAAVPYAQARDGKFIFVSSTTSTTVTTTTSFLRGTETCLILSSTTINQLCQGRRRRSLIRKDFDSGEDIVDIDASTVSGNAKLNELAIPEIQGEGKTKASNREGRFAWYYMTTTLTSVSTSTSTSTTFAATITVSAVLCTPAAFNYCSNGKK